MYKKRGNFRSYKRPKGNTSGEVVRVRIPRDKEVLGMIESRLGFGKMNVICTDKKIRICRVPGKYRRRIWVREGEIVLVMPWQFEGERKGDIIYKYRKAQSDWLRNKGLLEELDV
ncbi:MAG: translation initiation factor eIF-1A [archaeon]|nr:translation initiation factor eIF-1A [archaeon]